MVDGITSFPTTSSLNSRSPPIMKVSHLRLAANILSFHYYVRESLLCFFSAGTVRQIILILCPPRFLSLSLPLLPLSLICLHKCPVKGCISDGLATVAPVVLDPIVEAIAVGWGRHCCRRHCCRGHCPGGERRVVVWRADSADSPLVCMFTSVVLHKVFCLCFVVLGLVCPAAARPANTAPSFLLSGSILSLEQSLQSPLVDHYEDPANGGSCHTWSSCC